MSAKLRSVQALSTRTLEDSTDSYNRALNIYQQALAMQVPTVDSQELEAVSYTHLTLPTKA